MYKGSSTSFDYVEKVEDQVPRCACTVGGGGGEPCVAESGGGGSRHKEAEEVAGVEAAVEETGIERRRGDR
jgi:hypothetical protein